jgi:hypothetical protein
LKAQTEPVAKIVQILDLGQSQRDQWQNRFALFHEAQRATRTRFIDDGLQQQPIHDQSGQQPMDVGHRGPVA